MKIKTKKAFGEKHRVRREKRNADADRRLANASERVQRALERNRVLFEEDKQRVHELLAFAAEEASHTGFGDKSPRAS